MSEFVGDTRVCLLVMVPGCERGLGDVKVCGNLYELAVCVFVYVCLCASGRDYVYKLLRLIAGSHVFTAQGLCCC